MDMTASVYEQEAQLSANPKYTDSELAPRKSKVFYCCSFLKSIRILWSVGFGDGSAFSNVSNLLISTDTNNSHFVIY
jgi:hypothetical protein